MIRHLVVATTAAAGVVLLAPTPAHARIEPQSLAVPVQSRPSDIVAATAATLRVTVRRGDTLSGLAAKYCGSWSRWPAIDRANSIIRDPDLIYVGQRLSIPCARANRTASRSTPRPAAHAAAWVHPLRSGRLTSCFGPRWGSFHRGIDLAAPTGTRVRAAHAGVIVSAGWRWTGYGISIVVRHGNGTYTHYAHLSRESVSRGQHVSAGQTIGRVGSTGDSTGPHLHFEVMRHGLLGHQVNPARWLRNHGVRSGC